MPGAVLLGPGRHAQVASQLYPRLVANGGAAGAFSRPQGRL